MGITYGRFRDFVATLQGLYGDSTGVYPKIFIFGSAALMSFATASHCCDLGFRVSGIAPAEP